MLLCHTLRRRCDRGDGGQHVRRLRFLLLSLCLVTAGSGPLVAATSSSASKAPSSSVGCVTAAESFTGLAYCLDGNHVAPFIGFTEAQVRLVGMADVAGWQVPTRC